jgi:UPF0716 protein FxsA
MSLRRRLLTFGYPALELLTAWGLALWLGWGWALLIIVGGLPVGVVLIKRAGRSAFGELQRVSSEGGVPNLGARHGWVLLSGLLLAIPGVWTDVLAVAVLVPAIRRRVTAALGPRFEMNAVRASWAGTGESMNRTESSARSEVIIGTVIAEPEDDGGAVSRPVGG